jgi:hypothetical protein
MVEWQREAARRRGHRRNCRWPTGDGRRRLLLNRGEEAIDVGGGEEAIDVGGGEEVIDGADGWAGGSEGVGCNE